MTEQFSPRQNRNGRRANLPSPHDGPLLFSPPGSARDPTYLKDRSEIYERALQKSIMMRSSTKPIPSRKGPQQSHDRGKRLEPMQEHAEVSEAGWEDAEIVKRGQGGLMLDEEDGSGLLPAHRKTALGAAGVLGLVKQVMK